MTAYENYFDLSGIYFYELTGTAWLGAIVGLFIIFFVASKYNFSMQLTILSETLWLSVVAAITLNELIWILVVFEAGLWYYWVISSKLTR